MRCTSLTVLTAGCCLLLTEKYERITQKKSNVTIEQLCKNCPAEFVRYLKYCRQLKFADQPDYAYLKKLFTDLYHRNNFDKQKQFEWLTSIGRTVSTAAMAATTKPAGNQLISSYMVTAEDKENKTRYPAGAAAYSSAQLPPTHPYSHTAGNPALYRASTSSPYLANMYDSHSPTPCASPALVQTGNNGIYTGTDGAGISMTVPGAVYRNVSGAYGAPSGVHRHVSTAAQPPSPVQSHQEYIANLQSAVEQLESERDSWKRKCIEHELHKIVYEQEINNLRQHIANFTTHTYTSTTTLHHFFDPPVPKPTVSPEEVQRLYNQHLRAAQKRRLAQTTAAADNKPAKRQATAKPAAKTTTAAAAGAAPAGTSAAARAATYNSTHKLLEYGSNSDSSRPSAGTYEATNMPTRVNQQLLTNYA